MKYTYTFKKKLLSKEHRIWLEDASMEDFVAALTAGIYMTEYWKNHPHIPNCQNDVFYPPKVAQEQIMSEQPVHVGQAGEKYIETLLRTKHKVKNVTKTYRSGDFIVNNSICIEVKKYTKTIPSSEVSKFKRDLECTALFGGIFISLCAPISNMRKIEITSVIANNRKIPVIFLSEPTDELILLMIDTLEYLIAESIHCSDDHFDEISNKIILLNMAVNNLADVRFTISEFITTQHKFCIKLQESIIHCEVEMKNIINELADIVNKDEVQDTCITSHFVLDAKLGKSIEKLAPKVKWNITKTSATYFPVSFVFGKKCSFTIKREFVKNIGELLAQYGELIHITSKNVIICACDSTFELIQDLIASNVAIPN